MTQFWNERAGAVIDAISVGWFVLITVLVAGLVAAAWQLYPRWLPRRSWFRLPARTRRQRRRFRFRFRFRLRSLLPPWRRRKRERILLDEPVVVDVIAPDALPNVRGAVLRSRADAFAAEGRYAEAVRERLRAIVRDLVDGSVIPQHPDWTVTELAGAAAEVNRALEPALSGAATTFSDIWYGERPAVVDSDRQMRRYETEIHAIVAGRSMVTR